MPGFIIFLYIAAGALSIALLVWFIYAITKIQRNTEMIDNNTQKLEDQNATIIFLLSSINVELKKITNTKETTSSEEKSGTNDNQPNNEEAISEEAKVKPRNDRIVCPVCGTDQPSLRNVCFNCGCKFIKE